MNFELQVQNNKLSERLREKNRQHERLQEKIGELEKQRDSQAGWGRLYVLGRQSTVQRFSVAPVDVKQWWFPSDNFTW